jgi:hypothetical protein
MRREKTQISKIRNEKEYKKHQGNVRIIRNYFENLYSNKFENSEVDYFLDTDDHPKLTKRILTT